MRAVYIYKKKSYMVYNIQSRETKINGFCITMLTEKEYSLRISQNGICCQSGYRCHSPTKDSRLEGLTQADPSVLFRGRTRHNGGWEISIFLNLIYMLLNKLFFPLFYHRSQIKRNYKFISFCVFLSIFWAAFNQWIVF